ncbi:ATP-binding protein [Methylobacterium sp. J-090]|uniref:ATP-binding protein n=1 Tax=Methylobacterium sp. J-090 TaxID=2836666 RepID=UPI001FB94158|nr:ATP-binding protein [Methylobacterium sp. J-090]MCJ2082386.1 ATP-binding protein [Methylobacterium sp. J-090]
MTAQADLTPALRPSARARRLPVFRSLAGRLALAVFASVTLALLAAAAFNLWQEVHRYAEAKRETLSTIAQVFAASSARAVAEGDAAEATRTLSAIARRPDLVYVGIERPDGSTLADQGLGIRLDSDIDLDAGGSPFWLLGSRTAQVRVAILQAGLTVGTLVLVADTTDLVDRLLAILEASALASILALALGLAVSYGLHRSITQPIAELAATMDRVREAEDYGRVARIVRDDEVGVLARTFNALLATVRERGDRLTRHLERLESDVADRTADLHEAKEAAEAANGAKSSFLATMSHEIRTPLNGMLVMAELLAAADLPDRQKRYAEVIARSGQNLLAIINDILDFAKVEAGKIDLERISVEPAEIVDTVVSLFAEKARESNLDLAAFIAPDVPRRIVGDPVRLGQILSNFVNNALKFTLEGHVLVSLERAGPTHLRLSVRDTGVGIPAEKVGTLFSAFSQADQSTTRRFGGTGLGLSIAHRLALAMGGTMGVDSVVGDGSTFWAELPLEAVDEVTVGAHRANDVSECVVVATAGAATAESLRARLIGAGFVPVPADTADAAAAHWICDAADLVALGRRPTATGRVLAIARMGDPAAGAVLEAAFADDLLRWPVVQDEWDRALGALASGAPFTAAGRTGPVRAALAQFPGARVLVADDSAVNREVACEALARCGITGIVTVVDGKQAVEAARAEKFDLVLMDGSMPVLDGYDAARAIRAEEAASGRRVPIVALTAHVVGTAAEAWRDAGMDGTLTKPFTLAALAAMLSNFLSPEGTGLSEDAPEPMLAAPASDTLLDEEVVGGLVEMALSAGSGFAERIVSLYAEHAPTALAEIAAARAAGDATALASAAHSLKSMSLNIGGRALASCLAAVEEGARTRADLPELETLAEVERLTTETLAAITARIRVPEAA